MPRTTPPLLPKTSRLLGQLGTNLKQARLRRRYSAEVVAERSGTTRRTLQRVEKGDPSVAIGIYVRVLQALGLIQDLAALARDDELGRKLQDMALPARKRAPRRANADADEKEQKD